MSKIEKMFGKVKFVTKRLSIISLFILLFVNNLLLNASDFTKVISGNQQFVIPENAVNGDYVGYIQAFPEYQILGAAVAFSLKEGVNDIFTLNSNGLLTIKNSGALQVGEEMFNVLVSKNGYESTEISVSIKIISESSCVFVDPGFSVNGDGSRNNPKNNLSFLSDKHIFLKRGSTRIGGELVISGKSNIVLGAYGKGEKPKLVNNDASKVICIGGGSSNITIRDITLKSQSYPNSFAAAGIRFYDYPAGGNGGTNRASIINCEIENVESGIVAVPANANDVFIGWTHIHHVMIEGIYLKENGGNNEIHACYIHDVNEKYYENTNETVSSGDNIQLDNTRNAKINHCLIDRRNAGNKFCIIPGGPGMNLEIKDNYLMPYPGRPAIFWIGYNGVCEGNTFVGGDYAFWGYSGTPEIRNNIFRNAKSSAIILQGSQGTKIYNNLFYHNKAGISSQGPSWTAKNNIFTLSQGEMAYNSTGNIADYNLFNKEVSDMFGKGFHTLAKAQTGGQDAHSLVADPKFVNETGFDFRISETSPAIGAGVNLGITNDFQGTTRLNPPSIGPFAPGSDPVVIIPNNPPSIKINFNTNSFSGFVAELDASESSDPDNDQLSFSWTIPYGVCHSDSTQEKISILPSAMVENSTIACILKISDGEETVTKSINISVSPYKPQMEEGVVEWVTASAFQNPNNPENLIDNSQNSRWSVEGDNQWALFKLKNPMSISHLKLAFFPEQLRESYFDIQASTDNENWETILNHKASCDFSGNYHVFDFPSNKSTTEYTYIKLIGHGNSNNYWNSYTELKFFGTISEVDTTTVPDTTIIPDTTITTIPDTTITTIPDTTTVPDTTDIGSGPTGIKEIPDEMFTIYPNPTSDIVHIRYSENAIEPDFVRLLDLSGKVIYNMGLSSGREELVINLDYPSGMYLIQLHLINGDNIIRKLLIKKE